MNKILIIEDDTEINNMIAEALTKAGYSLSQAFSGTESLLYLDRYQYSLAVMDLMLPGLAGEALLPKLKEKQNIPVIVISAKDSLESKVDLLSSGADDYLTKPFAIQELLARVAVQIRHSARRGDAPVLKYKDLVLNPSDRTVTAGGRDIRLTGQEFKILELLMINPSKISSKQEIYDYAWDEYYIGEDKTVNVHISNIRRKLKEVSDEEYIETVWGIGFRMAKNL